MTPGDKSLAKRAGGYTYLAAQLGDIEVMRHVLDTFYRKLFADVLVGFFFAGRDRDALVERQLEFTARAFGYDVAYAGKPVREVHAALPPILAGHFDRRHKLLGDAITEHALSEDIRTAWLEFDRSFRAVVVRNA